MVLGIVETLISAILIEIIFEAWANREKIQAFLKKRKSSKESPPSAALIEDPPETVPPATEALAPPPTPAAEETTSGPQQLQLYKTILRIGASALIGFVVGGLVSGIVEYETESTIALGSGLSLLLIGLPTLLAWFTMYHFGPLKSKA